MSANVPKLFLSATSADFLEYRAELRDSLRDINGQLVHIRTQEDLSENGSFTLAMLADEIERSNLVIHLIGPSIGARPPKSSVKEFFECRFTDEMQRLGLSQDLLSELSYTQWEAWIAIFCRTPVHICMLSGSTPSENCDEKWNPPLSNQRHHLGALQNIDIYPDRDLAFETPADLARAIRAKGHIILEDAYRQLHPKVRTLSSYKNSLKNSFRRYLLRENMPFLRPRSKESADWDPNRLIEKLTKCNETRGFLLSAKGGVGKTRITLECADLAEKKGWEVLYVIPDPATHGPTTQDLLSARLLLRRHRKVLFAIEYIEQLSEVGYGELERELAALESTFALETKLLANCRPGFPSGETARRERAALKLMFRRVNIEPDSLFTERLSKYAAAKAAPSAMKRLGEQTFNRVCGSRPIIALLIAQQMERSCSAGELDESRIRGIAGEGELAYWLESRLKDDALLPAIPDDPLEDTNLSKTALLATLILGRAPIPKEYLIEISRNIEDFAGIKTIDGVGPEARCGTECLALRVCNRLINMGWINECDGQLEIAHDVVYDLLVEHFIFDNENLRTDRLGLIVRSFTTDPESFVRLVRNTDRAFGALDKKKWNLLNDTLSYIHTELAHSLVHLANESDNQPFSFALGALAVSPHFSDSLNRAWMQLFLPWLRREAEEYATRHALYRCMRSGILTEKNKQTIIPLCNAWLSAHGEAATASFVIAPALSIVETGSEEQPALIGFSAHWLELYSDQFEARYIYSSLLQVELSVLQKAISTEKLRRCFETWLSRHREQEQLSSILAPLLANMPEWFDKKSVTPVVASWVDKYPNSKNARFIIQASQQYFEVDAKGREVYINLCLAVLKHTQSLHDSEVIIDIINRYEKVPDRAAASVVSKVITHMKSSRPKKNSFIVRKTIQLLDKRPNAVCPYEFSVALEEWFKNQHPGKSMVFVLGQALASKSLQWPGCINLGKWSLKWLETNPDSEDASFILSRIFSSKQLDKQDLRSLIFCGASWLKRFGASSSAPFIYQTLIPRAGLDKDANQAVLESFLAWIENRPTPSDMLRPLGSLLRYVDLRRLDDLWRKNIRGALVFCSESIQTDVDSYQLCSDIVRARDELGFSGGEFDEILQSWLRKFGAERKASDIFVEALKKRNTQPGANESVIAFLPYWLSVNVRQAEAREILLLLINHSGFLKGELKNNTRKALWKALGAGMGDLLYESEKIYLIVKHSSHDYVIRASLCGIPVAEQDRYILRLLVEMSKGSEVACEPLLSTIEKYVTSTGDRSQRLQLVKLLATRMSVFRRCGVAGRVCLIVIDAFEFYRIQHPDFMDMLSQCVNFTSLECVTDNDGAWLRLKSKLAEKIKRENVDYGLQNVFEWLLKNKPRIFEKDKPEENVFFSILNRWLNEHSSRLDTGHTIRSLLVHAPDLIAEQPKIIEPVNQWFFEFGRDKLAADLRRIFVTRYRRCGALPESVLSSPRKWAIPLFPLRANDVDILSDLLSFYSAHDDNAWGELEKICAVWLRVYGDTEGAKWVLTGLFKKRPSSQVVGEEWIHISLNWLGVFNERPAACKVLTRVFEFSTAHELLQAEVFRAALRLVGSWAQEPDSDNFCRSGQLIYMLGNVNAAPPMGKKAEALVRVYRDRYPDSG